VSKVIVAGENTGAYVACLAAKSGTQADSYVLLGPMCGPSEEEMFQHITAPALVLVGRSDPNVPPEHSARAVDVMRKAGNKEAVRRLIAGDDGSSQQTALYREFLSWLHLQVPTPAEGTTRLPAAARP
jgi:predicted esterase